jgi:thiol-disulfide isomerase/thioredoxin
MPRTTLCALLVLSLNLAACGGVPDAPTEDRADVATVTAEGASTEPAALPGDADPQATTGDAMPGSFRVIGFLPEGEAPAGELPEGATMVAFDELSEEMRQALLAAMAAGDGERVQVKFHSKDAAAVASGDRAQAFRQRLLGQPFPAERLEDLDGRGHELKGGRTLINFWATWCAPCLEEMPLFEALAAASPGLAVVTVSNDFKPDDLYAYLARTSLSLPVVFDQDRALAGSLGLNTWPTTMVLDAEGRIERLFHAVHSLEELRARAGID